MRRLIAWLVFPATLGGALFGAIVAVERGSNPGLVLSIATFTSWLVIVVFERVQPYRETWNHSQGDLRADIAYLPTALGLNVAMEPGVKLIALALSAWLSGWIGTGLWPGDWPLLAQLGLACVVAEFFDYWPHRLLHEAPWLWRFHVIHHSPGRLYWLNATRAHPVEMIFRDFFSALPLAALGASAEVFLFYGLVTMIVGLFQHANIDFALGPLSWIFSVGEMHRWHHSDDLAEANHNYGNNFLFWDAVFGTRYRPADRETPAKLGIAGLEDFPRSWWRQLAHPFQRAT